METSATSRSLPTNVVSASGRSDSAIVRSGRSSSAAPGTMRRCIGSGWSKSRTRRRPTAWIVAPSGTTPPNPANAASDRTICPPFGRTGQAGGVVDIQAQVVGAVGRQLRRGRVEAHAQAGVSLAGPGSIGHPAADGDRGCRPGQGVGEGCERAVALVLDDDPVVLGDRRVHQRVVLGQQRGPVTLRQGMGELGRPLDVREQERDRAGRESHVTNLPLPGPGGTSGPRLTVGIASAPRACSPGRAVPLPSTNRDLLELRHGEQARATVLRRMRREPGHGCPSCGAPFEPGEKFCGTCGTALTTDAVPAATGLAAPIAAPTAPQATERRLVCVLFADLVGFTPFAEERDAEDVRDTLDRYFDRRARSSNATAAPSRSSSAMPSWPCGARRSRTRTTPSGPSARRWTWSTPCRGLGDGIQARAGILTGEAAVTIGATNQGMVAGDLVNTASRLQSVAAPGTVLVGEATSAPRQGHRLRAGRRPDAQGQAGPVPAWRAVRVVGERRRAQSAEALEAPFVGRDEELRLLKDLFHATGRERPRTCSSASSARPASASRGSRGSSSSTSTALRRTVYWHDGRAPAYGEGITFWALGEMVRDRAGLAETDDEARPAQDRARSSPSTCPTPTSGPGSSARC